MDNRDIRDNPMIYYQEPNGQYSHFDSTRYDVDTPVFVKKANILIRRIGTSSLFSEKLLLAALATAKMKKKTELVKASEIAYFEDLYRKSGTDFSDGLVSEFKNEDIKKLFHIKTSSYYSEIDNLMNNEGFMSNWNILYQDKNVIASTSCLTGTAYDKRTGTTYIKWNPDIAEKVLCSKGNGTMLSLELMGQFKDLQSFNTYQLLKEELSYNEFLQTVVRKKAPLKEYCTEFDLAEFRFLISTNQIAIKSPDSEQVKKLIRQNRWAEAEDMLAGTDGAKYTRWTDFRRYTLLHVSAAINGFKDECFSKDTDDFNALCTENHPTDIHFRCEEIKTGKKVSGIRFFVRWDNVKVVDEEKEEPEDRVRHTERFREDISLWTGTNISVADMEEMIAAAGGDTDRIREACEYTSEYNKDIDNITTFILDAIKKGLGSHSSKKGRRVEEKVTFTEIETRFNPGNILTEEQGLSAGEKKMILEYIYDLMNPQEDTIKIARMERPSDFVAKRIWSLIPEEIGYMFTKIRERKDQGKTTTKNYILTMLYNAHDEYEMSGYGKTEKKDSSLHDFEQRKYTDEQYREFEAKKLGIKK